MDHDDEEDDLALRKGDDVVIKETREYARIVGASDKPGVWRVRMTESGEITDVPETSLEPVY
jgi:hypothetical protein